MFGFPRTLDLLELISALNKDTQFVFLYRPYNLFCIFMFFVEFSFNFSSVLYSFIFNSSKYIICKHTRFYQNSKRIERNQGEPFFHFGVDLLISLVVSSLFVCLNHLITNSFVFVNIFFKQGIIIGLDDTPYYERMFPVAFHFTEQYLIKSIRVYFYFFMIIFQFLFDLILFFIFLSRFILNSIWFFIPTFA